LAYPKNPFDLTQSSTETFSASNAKNCTLSPNYFIHDYDGFQSNWKMVNDGFFGLVASNANSLDITVRINIVTKSRNFLTIIINV